MKKSSLILLTLLGTTPPAQLSAESLNDLSISGYGGPLYRNLRTDGEDRHTFGVRGAMLFRQSFSLGLQAGTDIDQEEESRSDKEEDKERISYGGVYTSLALFPGWVVHPVLSASYNWGVLEVNDKNADFFNMIQLEPGLELNIHRMVRVSVSGGPRRFTGISFRGRKNADYEGTSYSAAVSVGIF